MRLNPCFLAFAVLSVATLPCWSAAPKLMNAALRQYGVRVDIVAGEGARKDPKTEPEGTFDNNLHTRQVISGAPYTFTIELVDRLPIEKIGFADSDYQTEMAPKEIEIALDDGSVLRQTLELKRPEKRKAAWQEVAIGKTARTIKVTVLSNHQPSEKVNWGGLGEIAVWTPADLEEKFRVPGYDAMASAFVHVPPTQTVDGTDRVELPPIAKRGEHPCLLFTKSELAEFRAALKRSERGKPALESMLKVADASLAGMLDFPDPKGPLGQMNDRGDAVAKRHDRLSMDCGTLGFAYALTGEEKYARRAAEILNGYAERYPLYPEHRGVNKSDSGKVMGQRLSEAMWLIPLIEAYDYIQSGDTASARPVLTEKERQLIDNQLLRAGVTFIRRKEPDLEVAARDKANADWRMAPKGKSASNWLLFYNTATIMAGTLLNDSNMVDLAAADFRELILNGIGSDGMWGEGAIGYQFFAMSAMAPGLETAARQGIDLWSFADRRVKMLFDSPLRYAYPDGSAPGINDSGRARFGNWSTMSYDYAWLRYHDPAHAFLVNESPRQLYFSQAVCFPTRIYEKVPEPKATRFPSTVFENLGYAILRNDNTYVLMDYGAHGGVHGHLDKLNMILFAKGADRGDEIGGEPGFHRYEDPLHDEWTKQTIGHNTLAVDERSQQPTEGKLLVFEDTPELKVMRAESAGAYAGVIIDRVVIVTPDGVLDLYHGRSKTAHTWDRTFRYEGGMDGFPKQGGGEPLARRDGFQHVKVASKLAIGQPWQGTWNTKAGEFIASLAEAPGQQVMLANGPDQEQFAIAHQQGTNADFAALYQMKAWRRPATSLRWLAGETPGVKACELMVDGIKTQVFVAHEAQTWQGAEWRSDARVLCVRTGGGQTELLVCGGTFAERGKQLVRLPARGNALVKGSEDGLKIATAWAPAVESVQTTAKRKK